MILVLSVNEKIKNQRLGIAILIFGFSYFFGKNIINLILNINLLGVESYRSFPVYILQFGWFFPSIMFFIANTYFAFKYCIPYKK